MRLLDVMCELQMCMRSWNVDTSNAVIVLKLKDETECAVVRSYIEKELFQLGLVRTTEPRGIEMCGLNVRVEVK